MRNYFYGGLLLLLWACSPERESLPYRVFDIEANLNETIDSACTWNDLATSVKMLPLETNDSVLLATFRICGVVGDRIVGINRVVNKTADGWIMLTGAKSDIRIFDTQGKQIRKIDRQGKGGQEYTELAGLMVEEDPFVIRLVNDKRILTYNDRGEYLRTDSLEKSCFKLIPLGKKAYVGENMLFPVDRYKYQVDVINLQGKVEKTLFPVTAEILKSEHLPFTAFGLLQSTEEGAFYKNPYCDTLYRILPDGQIQPEAVFCCGKYRYALILDRTSVGMEEIEEGLIAVSGYHCWGDCALISYQWKGKMVHEGWQAGADRPFVRKTGGFEHNGLALKLADGSTVDVMPQWIRGGKAYFVVEAYRLAGHVPGITEESNPVVFIITLKQRQKIKQTE